MGSKRTREVTIKAITIHLAYHARPRRWLAENIGMTTHQLSRRMTNKVAFTTDDIDDIAHVLNISVVRLLADGDIAQTRGV